MVHRYADLITTSNNQLIIWYPIINNHFDNGQHCCRQSVASYHSEILSKSWFDNARHMTVRPSNSANRSDDPILFARSPIIVDSSLQVDNESIWLFKRIAKVRQRLSCIACFAVVIQTRDRLVSSSCQLIYTRICHSSIVTKLICSIESGRGRSLNNTTI